VCALEVLADAAKVNYHVLCIVEDIAKGICNTLAPSGRTTAASSGTVRNQLLAKQVFMTIVVDCFSLTSETHQIEKRCQT